MHVNNDRFRKMSLIVSQLDFYSRFLLDFKTFCVLCIHLHFKYSISPMKHVIDFFFVLCFSHFCVLLWCLDLVYDTNTNTVNVFAQVISGVADALLIRS